MDFVKRTYAAIQEINAAMQKSPVVVPERQLWLTQDLTENDFRHFPDLPGVVMAYARGQESGCPTEIHFQNGFDLRPYPRVKPWDIYKAEIILVYRDFRYVLKSVSLPKNIAKLNRWEN